MGLSSSKPAGDTTGVSQYAKSTVQTQFPNGNQSSHASVFDSVLAELQGKITFTADELSGVDREASAEGKLIQLLKVLDFRDCTSMLEQLFDATCRHGIIFSNLPLNQNVLYQAACDRMRKEKGAKRTSLTGSRPRSAIYTSGQYLDQTHSADNQPLRSLSLLEDNDFDDTPVDQAHVMLQTEIKFCHKRAVFVIMDDSDHKNANALLGTLSESQPTGAVPTFQPQPHKIVEITREQNSLQVPVLVDAVMSRSSSCTQRIRHQQDRCKCAQQHWAINFEQLKRAVTKAILQRQESSVTSFPLTVYIKAQSAFLCRDLVSLFLMGSNSLYLFIYNWKNEPVVVSRSGQLETLPHEEEILKWIHTIGFCSRSQNNPSPAVSAKVVMADFDNLLKKTGDQKTAEEVANSPTRKLCDQLTGHECSSVMHAKPLYLIFDKKNELQHSSLLQEEFADSNFQPKEVDPRWVYLLFAIGEKTQPPMLLFENFLVLAQSVNLNRNEAIEALSFFKELKMVFLLPEDSKSELKGVVFTDMEWLVNTLIEVLSPPPFNDRGLLWNAWEDLTKTGIMSEGIKKSIEKKASKAIIGQEQLKLSSQWVFTLLHEVGFFTDLSTKKNECYFCPLYLSDADQKHKMNVSHQEESFRSSKMAVFQVEESRFEVDNSDQLQTNSNAAVIPSLYLRPRTKCITDQYMMRLFCWITRCGILTLQECLSKTWAIFLHKECNLRFTISNELDCLKISVESSFSGKELNNEPSRFVAQQLVYSIVRASEEMRDTWYAVLFTQDNRPSPCEPDRYFQCCDRECYKYCAGSLHLSKVVYANGMLCLECEESSQLCRLNPEKEFWIDQVLKPSVARNSAADQSQELCHRSIKESTVVKNSFVAQFHTPNLKRSFTFSLDTSSRSTETRKKGLIKTVVSTACIEEESRIVAGDTRHILDRCERVLYDHLGVDLVAVRMLQSKLIGPAQVLAICKKESYKSEAERFEAITEIIKGVKEKGPYGFTMFVRILEQTGDAYLSHRKIIEELHNDHDYSSYLPALQY